MRGKGKLINFPLISAFCVVDCAVEIRRDKAREKLNCGTATAHDKFVVSFVLLLVTRAC
jgi:hypothetical protein